MLAGRHVEVAAWDKTTRPETGPSLARRNVLVDPEEVVRVVIPPSSPRTLRHTHVVRLEG